MDIKKKISSHAAQNAAESGTYYWGMDTTTYPGDAFMQDWFEHSPFYYTGYYFAPTPDRSSSGNSWMGKRSTLVAQGWGILPIYLGRQYGWSNLTSSQGETDAQDAISLAQSEGFPSASHIYLDVEGGTVSTALLEYISGWANTVAESIFWPGIYCSSSPASSIIKAVTGCNARYWVAHYTLGNPNPNNSAPNPADSGISNATTWQAASGKSFTFGSHSHNNIDVNTSVFTDPSR